MHILLLIMEIVILACCILSFFAQSKSDFETDLFVIILVAAALHIIMNVLLLCRGSSCVLSCSK